MDRDEGGRRKVLVALFNSKQPEFPVCETGDHVEGSDPQNDKKKYPWLNFFIGDTFELLDSNQLHYIVKDSTNKIGIIQKSRVSFSNPTNPIIQEAKSTLKIWIQAYKQLYLLREVDDQNDLRRSIDELIYWSQQIISGALTKGEEVKLISRLQRRIDAVNKQFDLEKVPRMMDGTRLNHKDSCVNLYNAYTRASRSSVGPTGGCGDDGNLGNQHLHPVLVEVGGQTWIEDILIYCQLYSERKGDFVSERWFVNHSRPKPGGLFMDLGGVDLCLDLHLVVLVYRVGRILNQEGTKKRDPGIRSLTQQVGCMYKRPLSGGVQSLQKFFLTERRSFSTNQPQSIQVKLLSCDERDFFHLHSLAIKNSNKLTPAQTGPSFLTFHLETLSGSAEIVLQQNMAKLKDCSLIKRLGFPPVIMPGEVRNDLFLKLERGQFPTKPGAAGKNIEVNLAVYSRDGIEVEDCISPAVGGGPPQPAVYYHTSSPHWGETYRLQLPIDLVKASSCHVRLEYRYCSLKDKQEKKLIGFSFLNLMHQNETVICDGIHDLPIIRCDPTDTLHPAIYLAASEQEQDSNKQLKEYVRVSTLLCSTKLTQNPDLMHLLKWRSHQDRIPDILTKVMKTPGEEIVKFLQDILDAVFAMFSTEEGNSTAHSGLVFQTLLHILSCVQETKFQQFQEVLDKYIEDHFAAALVYKGLMSCVRHCAEIMPKTDKQDAIRKCFQSLSYVFKFIVSSRQLFIRATRGQNEDSFRTDIHLLYNCFNKMLMVNADNVLPTQVVFLNSVASIYPSIIKVMPVLDIVKLTSLTLDSLGQDRSQYLLRAALGAARDALKSELWKEKSCRYLLLTPAINLVNHHLQTRREVETCSKLLLELVNSLYQERKENRGMNKEEENEKLGVKEGEGSSWWKDVYIFAEAAIGPLGLAVIAEEDDGDESPENAGLVVALLGLLDLLDEEHHKLLWRSQPSQLGRLFLVLTEVLARPAVPSEWVSLKLSLVNTIASTVQMIGLSLPHLRFDKQQWMGYYQLAGQLITSPQLQIELVKKQGRLFVGLDEVEDLRFPLAEHMVQTWNSCSQQIQLVPSLVGPILEVTLIPLSRVRRIILPLLVSLMQTEQQHKGNFRQTETELIDKLDILISENKGDEEYREIFNSLMLDLVEELDPTWRESGQVFVSSVSRLLERLLDYRGVLQGEENINKRLSCTLNLLQFYRDDFNRQEMYIRYIYKLEQLHLLVGNPAEAAATLLLHANLLDWTTRTLHADLRYPAQQEWQRKEALYIHIIHLYDSARLWEPTIPLCKELADLYEKRTYDYVKLSALFRQMADFYSKIISEFRPDSEYFKVGFYGLSFPYFVRNKEFVYRGLEFEKIGEFTTRLLREFPTARLCGKTSENMEELKNQEGEHILIVSVKPLPKDSGTYFGPEVPQNVKNFYAVNQIRTFQYDRPYHKGEIDKNNEFKTLWIERNRYETMSEFPGILKWFEISSTIVSQISPVEYACESVSCKNAELRKFIAQYSTNRSENVMPFTMRLQGNIDAAVNGGFAKYKSAFFTDTFSEENPKYTHVLETLAGYIGEQVALLQDGLQLHGELAPEPVQPLHQRLVEVFSTLRTEMEFCSSFSPSPRSNRTSRIVNTPLPPIPGETEWSPSPSLYGPISGLYEGRSGLDESSLYGRIGGTSEYVYSPVANYQDISPLIISGLTLEDRESSRTDSDEGVELRGGRRYLSNSSVYENSKRSSSSSLSFTHLPSTLPLNSDRTPPLPPRNSFRSHRTDENSTSNCSLNLFIHSTPPPVPLHPYATALTPTPVPLHPYATAPTPTPVPLHPYPTAFLASSPVRPLPPSTQPPPPLPSQNINNLSDSVRPPSLPRRVSHKSPKISPSQSPTRPGPPLFQRTVERRRPPPLPPKSSNSDI